VPDAEKVDPEVILNEGLLPGSVKMLSCACAAYVRQRITRRAIREAGIRVTTASQRRDQAFHEQLFALQKGLMPCVFQPNRKLFAKAADFGENRRYA